MALASSRREGMFCSFVVMVEKQVFFCKKKWDAEFYQRKRFCHEIHAVAGISIFFSWFFTPGPARIRRFSRPLPLGDFIGLFVDK
jgi:hypothetical protein